MTNTTSPYTKKFSTFCWLILRLIKITSLKENLITFENRKWKYNFQESFWIDASDIKILKENLIKFENRK